MYCDNFKYANMLASKYLGKGKNILFDLMEKYKGKEIVSNKQQK